MKNLDDIQAKGLVGLNFTEEGIAVAQVKRSPDKAPVLEAAQFFPCRENKEMPNVLKTAIKELNLGEAHTVCALDTSAYEIFLVEEPSVEADELSAALRWRIKDYLEYPVQEALLDYIEVPKDGRGEKVKMVYVAAVKKTIVDHYATLIEEAGLSLQVIDTTESSIKNIAQELFKEGSRAVLHLDKMRSQLLMMGGLKLYMMRYLEVDLSPLFSSRSIEKTEREGIYNELAREIQRSLDYCAGNLYQKRPTDLIIAPLEQEDLHLIQSVGEGLGLPAQYFDFSKFLECKASIGRTQQHQCMAAIGAALRQDRVLT